MHTTVRHIVASRSSRALRAVAHLGLGAALVASAAGCTSRQTVGESPVFLIINQLTASSGAEPDKFSGTLASDVLTNGGIFADNGEINVRIALKDPGSTTSPTTPSTTNLVTINRYRVRFLRSDGRNQQGVDVPYEFDGAVTITATPGGASAVFTLVRVQSKLEAPLKALAGLGGAVAISTIAEVTVYGFDQAGREVSASAMISVNFADWADPEG